MKKVLVLAVVSVLILSVFVACGTKEEMKDDITTMMSEVSTAMDDMAEDITGNGKITTDSVTEETTDEDITGDTTEEVTTDVTEDVTKDRTIMDDIVG